MEISIEYCRMWNYEPKALRARDILSSLGEGEIKLIPGGGGVFEIRVDGELKFSKKKLGRFPREEELSELINR